MTNIVKLYKKIVQPGFHNITQDIEGYLKNKLLKNQNKSGILTIFCLHTSCALLINEAWDPTAQSDLEKFLDYIAPEDLRFIEHTIEGPDDSPAHMKSALLQPSLTLIIDEGQCVLGRWQGIFLAEFRHGKHERCLALKYQPDHT